MKVKYIEVKMSGLPGAVAGFSVNMTAFYFGYQSLSFYFGYFLVAIAAGGLAGAYFRLVAAEGLENRYLSLLKGAVLGAGGALLPSGCCFFFWSVEMR